MLGFTQGIIQRPKRTIVLELLTRNFNVEDRLWLICVVEIFLNLLQ
jgi:hypothetical protein